VEHAAGNAGEPYLEGGEGSVGTHLDVSHTAATTVGMKVWAEAELTAVEGRKLTFAVTAWDEMETIGTGVHQRFVIQTEKFLSRAGNKGTT